MSNTSGSVINKGREKWSAPINGEPNMKTINGKPFEYNKETKHWDKQPGYCATVIQVLPQKWPQSQTWNLQHAWHMEFKMLSTNLAIDY